MRTFETTRAKSALFQKAITRWRLSLRHAVKGPTAARVDLASKRPRGKASFPCRFYPLVEGAKSYVSGAFVGLRVYKGCNRAEIDAAIAEDRAISRLRLSSRLHQLRSLHTDEYVAESMLMKTVVDRPWRDGSRLRSSSLRNQTPFQK